jgi:hypothetical protein
VETIAIVHEAIETRNSKYEIRNKLQIRNFKLTKRGEFFSPTAQIATPPPEADGLAMTFEEYRGKGIRIPACAGKKGGREGIKGKH